MPSVLIKQADGTYLPASSVNPLPVSVSGGISAGELAIDQTTPGTTNGVQITTATAQSGVSSTAYEASHVIKASAGRLFGVIGYNSKTSAQFIQIHDSATVPANTAVPIMVIPVSAQDSFFISMGDFPYPFTNGIVVCNSSTAPTKTIGSADCFFTAVYA